MSDRKGQPKPDAIEPTKLARLQIARTRTGVKFSLRKEPTA